MPWANTTFKLDLFTPFATYFDHLMADPSTNPIRLPNLVGLGRTLQTFAAGMVIAFDPITPGSALCANACANLPAQFDYPAVVKFIGDLWPGNENIDSWLTAYANGTANVPTQAQIDKNIELLENGQQFWSFGNTPLPDSSAKKGFNPSSLAPFFHQLFTNLGLNPPPLNTGPGEATDEDTPRIGPFTNLRASEKLSPPSLPPSTTPKLIPVNLNTAPVTPDSQVTKDLSTQAQQDVQSITGAVTEAPADAAAVPNNVDPTVGQTLPTDTTPDGNMAVPGKVGGNGTRPRGRLGDVLRSAGDQISSSISKVTRGLTGGTKSDNTDNTGGTGGRHQAQSDKQQRQHRQHRWHRRSAPGPIRHNSDNTGNTGGTGGTGGRYRAK